MDLRFVIIAAPLLLAAADTPFTNGLWELRNVPGVATLDGRPLAELPIGPIKTHRLCIRTGKEADPNSFLTRDLGADCKVTSAKLSGGKIDIKGTCPNVSEGPAGIFRLTGKAGRDRYAVDFQTTAFGENGRMTFSGKMSGRRVGICPAR
jgi:hypothetical protein